jgi:glycosyltransferase involved in cell wall biosynthesis
LSIAPPHRLSLDLETKAPTAAAARSFTRSFDANRKRDGGKRPYNVRSVVFLVAVREDQKCGVADYTRQLARAFAQQGVAAEVEELTQWSLSALRRLARTYRSQPQTILHLQYPSLGMGKSWAPALLPLTFSRGRIYATLHEFEQFNWVRKLYFLPFAQIPDYLIFTNEHECRRFTRFFRSKPNGGHVLPIGNNVDVHPVAGRPLRRTTLVYFGQIAPNKGIEEFLQTVELIRQQNIDIPCSIVGALPDPNTEIARKIRDCSAAYGIDCLFNLPSTDVSRELQNASIALLPFPGGVSDKRGSALACLQHGIAVITKHSDLTPRWWRDSTHGSENAQTSARLIAQLLAGRIEKIPRPSVLADALREREWRNIAASHLALYQSNLR